MSAARVSLKNPGQIRKLDRAIQPSEIVKPEDAADATLLARLLRRVLADIASLKRTWVPARITFDEVVSTGTSTTPQRFTFPHGLGGLVDWTVVRLYNRGTVTLPLVAEVKNDGTVLVLDVFFPATLSVRIEAAG